MVLCTTRANTFTAKTEQNKKQKIKMISWKHLYRYTDRFNKNTRTPLHTNATHVLNQTSAKQWFLIERDDEKQMKWMVSQELCMSYKRVAFYTESKWIGIFSRFYLQMEHMDTIESF